MEKVNGERKRGLISVAINVGWGVFAFLITMISSKAVIFILGFTAIALVGWKKQNSFGKKISPYVGVITRLVLLCVGAMTASRFYLLRNHETLNILNMDRRIFILIVACLCIGLIVVRMLEINDTFSSVLAMICIAVWLTGNLLLLYDAVIARDLPSITVTVTGEEDMNRRYFLKGKVMTLTDENGEWVSDIPVSYGRLLSEVDIGDSFTFDIRGGAGDIRYVLDMRAQMERQV